MKKRKTKKTRNKKNIKFWKSSNFFLVLAIIFIASIFIYVGAKYINLSFITDFGSDPDKIVIKDDCSMITGKLIHEIRDQQDCKLKCKNACNVRDQEYFSSNFVANENACHTCNCFCD